MRRWILKGLAIALLIALVLAGASYVVMILWNWLIPGIFAAKPIDFLQAMGLLVLGRLLFGGRGGFGHRMHWRGRMHERWARMTPEQREKFREGMRGRCGHHRKAGGEAEAQ